MEKLPYQSDHYCRDVVSILEEFLGISVTPKYKHTAKYFTESGIDNIKTKHDEQKS